MYGTFGFIFLLVSLLTAGHFYVSGFIDWLIDTTHNIHCAMTIFWCVNSMLCCFTGSSRADSYEVLIMMLNCWSSSSYWMHFQSMLLFSVFIWLICSYWVTPERVGSANDKPVWISVEVWHSFDDVSQPSALGKCPRRCLRHISSMCVCDLWPVAGTGYQDSVPKFITW